MKYPKYLTREQNLVISNNRNFQYNKSEYEVFGNLVLIWKHFKKT